MAELRKAQAVDPLSLSIQASLALAFFYARRYEEAVRQCRLALEMEENFWLAHMFLSWTYLQTHRFPEALAAAERAVQLGANDPVCLAALGFCQALSGQRDAAERSLAKLTALALERYVPAAEIAMLCLGLGDVEQCLQWLAKAQHEKSLRLIYLKVEPRFDSLRSESRFLELLKTVGLD